MEDLIEVVPDALSLCFSTSVGGGSVINLIILIQLSILNFYFHSS